MSESTELVAGKYAVFNKERVKRYAWLLTTKLRDRLHDISEALEEEAEPRPTRDKRKQKVKR